MELAKTECAPMLGKGKFPRSQLAGKAGLISWFARLFQSEKADARKMRKCR
jgi:hypothetical protein